MKARLKSIDLGGEIGFFEFRPPDPDYFNVHLTAHIGAADGPAADLFQITVVSARMLDTILEAEPAVWGRHMLILARYDPDMIVRLIEKQLDHCTGADWDEVAQKVARIGYWEFEDYRPFAG